MSSILGGSLWGDTSFGEPVDLLTHNIVSTLALDHEALSGIVFVNANNSLNLNQSVNSVLLAVQNTGNILALSQEVSVGYGVYNASLTSRLDFVEGESDGLQQAVSRVIDISVESVLELEQEAGQIYTPENTLALVQTVTFGRSLVIEHDLGLSDSTVRQLQYGRQLASTLALAQSVAFSLGRAGVECEYSPFVGEGGIETEPPVLGSASLTLTFPYSAPTSTLLLRNPSFGNQHTLGFSRIYGETRGGTLIVFSDPIWPKVETLSMQITGLTEAQTESLLEFLGDSLGQEIGLLDWENRQWRGIITTPDAEVADNGECNKSVSLTFEGQLA